MKVMVIAIFLALFILAQPQVLGSCIQHILHESGHEDLECANN